MQENCADMDAPPSRHPGRRGCGDVSVAGGSGIRSPKPVPGRIDSGGRGSYLSRLVKSWGPATTAEDGHMRVANSMKTLKKRHRACRLIKRKGRTYVINKENPRFKARQG